MSPRSAHTHDAWIVGTHELNGVPSFYASVADVDDVIVHDLRSDLWTVMNGEQFLADFEWIK